MACACLCAASLPSFAQSTDIATPPVWVWRSFPAPDLFSAPIAPETANGEQTIRIGTAVLSVANFWPADSFPDFEQAGSSAATPSPQRKPAAAPAPAGGPQAPSLGDLGFPTAETKGSAQEQARLDKRSHMLKIHQKLGLITLAPLVATLIASNGAKAPHINSAGVAVGGGTTTSRDLHAGLGIATAGLYFTTASFAIFAPKIPGTKTRGPIKLHKILACIHGPGMVLTPILGAMAYKQISDGQRVHGIAKAHGTVAAITAVAYGAAMLSVSIKF
jgi:hypothetical protein